MTDRRGPAYEALRNKSRYKENSGVPGPVYSQGLNMRIAPDSRYRSFDLPPSYSEPVTRFGTVHLA